MPYPDFSELTFGFAFLREFEREFCDGQHFPSAPDFITQHDEASLGYDVEAQYGAGTPVFFQFKRSFVVKSGRAIECKSSRKSDLTPFPFYRMNLRKKDGYSQHRLLQESELAGDDVFYVTSQVEKPKELSFLYRNWEIISRATALFSPNDIPCPTDDDQHFVSFRADAPVAYLFSADPEEVKRTLPPVRTLFLEKVRSRQVDPEGRAVRLRAMIDRLSGLDWAADTIANRFESPLVKASILAMLVLDAQMTVVPDEPMGTTE